MSVAGISSRDKSLIILTDGNDVPFTMYGIKSFVIDFKDVMSW